MKGSTWKVGSEVVSIYERLRRLDEFKVKSSRTREKGTEVICFEVQLRVKMRALRWAPWIQSQSWPESFSFCLSLLLCLYLHCGSRWRAWSTVKVVLLRIMSPLSWSKALWGVWNKTLHSHLRVRSSTVWCCGLRLSRSLPNSLKRELPLTKKWVECLRRIGTHLESIMYVDNDLHLETGGKLTIALSIWLT